MEVNLQKLSEFGKEMFKKYPYTEYANELRLDDEVYALFGYVTQIKDLTHEMVDDIVEMVGILNEFIREYDTELQEKVTKTLKDWQKSGFLEVIIEEALQTQMDDLQLQLDNTMTQEEFKEWSKNLLDGSPRIFKNTVAQLLEDYPKGTTGVALVKETNHKYVWNGTTWEDFGVYQAQVIEDNSISVDKTNFIKTGKNKFNVDTIKTGYYGVDGTYYENEAYRYSDFIVVTAGQVFSFSTNIADNTDSRGRQTISFITAYNDNEVMPNDGGRNVNTYTVPTGVTRIRISSGVTTFTRQLQMELGEETTSFEKYKRTVNYLHGIVETEDVVKQGLKTDRMLLPENALPSTFVFVNGTLNSGVFSAVSSTRVATRAMSYAPKGSKILVGNPNTEFTIHLLTKEGAYIKNTNWSSSPYEFEEDSYFRVAQRFVNETTVTDKDWNYFTKGLILSSNYPYAVALKSDTSSGSGEAEDGKKIILPPIYPIVAGQEANIYLDNILQYGNYYTSENFKVRGKGNIVEGAYQFVSETDQTLNFDYSKGNERLMNKQTQIKAISKTAGASKTKTVLIIGESTSDSVFFISELLKKFSSDTMKIKMLGTRGTTPNLHEGHSGWKALNFVSSQTYKDMENAFYNPVTKTFDLTYYMSENNFTVPFNDFYVFINLGINDVSEGQSITQTLSNYKIMVDSILKYKPSIKIIFGLTNLPSRFPNQNGTDLKNNILSFIEALIETYGGRESEGFFLAPIYLNIDPFWDMRYSKSVVSNRNPKETFIGTDLVHPSEIGYLKQADVHYNTIKYVASTQ